MNNKRETFTDHEVKYLREVLITSGQTSRAARKFLVKYPDHTYGAVYTKARKVLAAIPPEMPEICVNCGKSFPSRGDLRCQHCKDRGVNWND